MFLPGGHSLVITTQPGAYRFDAGLRKSPLENRMTNRVNAWALAFSILALVTMLAETV